MTNVLVGDISDCSIWGSL